MTVTVWGQASELFAASFAVHVIVVIPTGYGAFNARASLLTPTMEVTPQLSVAVAEVIETTAEHNPASAV
ncbi:MAG: hypothetical protein MZV63_56055 [Marinilabiliales bacterium]|nr:hypothetical protein [Marinilabiliales bacterium]